MIEWTEAARRALDGYCARSRAALAGTGADADEVIEDLRRHVDEEVRAAHLTVVTEGDLRRILDRVGEAGSAVEQKAEASRQPSAPPAESWYRKKPGFTLLVLGVVLPLAALILEWMTGISAGVLFDPISNWLQIFAVALVPAANLWMWLAGRARDARRARLLGWLNGAVFGVGVYYSITYLPFVPWACMGILFFGLGLIPLAPYFVLIATPFLRARYRERTGAVSLPGAWKGAAVSFVILVLMQLPAAVTYYGLDRAASEDAATKTAA